MPCVFLSRPSSVLPCSSRHAYPAQDFPETVLLAGDAPRELTATRTATHTATHTAPRTATHTATSAHNNTHSDAHTATRTATHTTTLAACNK